jgi:hypothetical protein
LIVFTPLADETVTLREYTAAGHLWKEWGSQTYSIRYTYDEQGRMTKLETFRGIVDKSEPDSEDLPDPTPWQYEAETGRLEKKIHADTNETVYQWTAAGRLALRQWARPNGMSALYTTYRYHNSGDLLSVDYSDSTPDVLYTRNRAGQATEAKDGTLDGNGTAMSSTRFTHTYTYNDLGSPLIRPEDGLCFLCDEHSCN